MDQEQVVRQLMEKIMARLDQEAPVVETKNHSDNAFETGMKEQQAKTQAAYNANHSATSSSPSNISAGSTGKVTRDQYPLGETMPDKILSRSGRKLNEFTLDKVMSGDLKPEDFRIAPETLEMQAQVAEAANRPWLGNNMRRASELIAVPDEELLQAYDALRPYRKSKQELLDLADHLEKTYGCKVSADFIREAAEVYERRGRLRREYED